jgi:hypothetical protein
VFNALNIIQVLAEDSDPSIKITHSNVKRGNKETERPVLGSSTKPNRINTADWFLTNCWIRQSVSGLLNTHGHTYVPIRPVQRLVPT